MSEHEHEQHHHHEDMLDNMTEEEKRIALLEHMAHHNEHHAEEMKELAEGTTGAARMEILAAVALFDAGNEKLRTAITLLKGGE